MVGGILIGIGVAALSFLVVWLLRKGDNPSLLSLILLVAALVALSIEGVMMSTAIKAKKSTDNTVSLVQETLMNYLPSQGKDYVITTEQATAVKLALNVAVPTIGNKIEADDIANKTVMEATDALRLSVEQSTAKLVRKSVWLLVITAVVITILMYVLFNIGESIGGASRKASRGGRNGRPAQLQSHRAPRRVHR